MNTAITEYAVNGKAADGTAPRKPPSFHPFRFERGWMTAIKNVRRDHVREIFL